MTFDWRYAFHSFWFLMAYMILLSTAIFFNQEHPWRMAVGAILALIVVDALFTHHYPYFNRVDREGWAIAVSVAIFALLTLLASNFSTNWPSIVWDFTAFCLASLGGTIDGYLVRPTRLAPDQTYREVQRSQAVAKDTNR